MRGSARQWLSVVACLIVLVICMGSKSIYYAMASSIAEAIGGDTQLFMNGMALASIISFVGSFPLAKLVKATSPRICLEIGVCFSAAALFIIGNASSFPMFIVGCVCLGGATTFGSYAAFTGVLSHFWGKRTQYAVGFATGAGAFASSWTIMLVSQMLKLYSYPEIFMACGVIFLILGSVAVFVFIGKMPRGQKIGAKDEAEAEEETAEVDKESQSGITLKQALHTPSFYVFLIAVPLCAIAYNTIASYTSLFFTTGGMDKADAGTLTGWLASACAIAKLCSGAIMKKVPIRYSTLVIYGCWAIGVICCLMWIQIQSFPFAMLAITFCGVGGLLTIASNTFAIELFGLKDIASISFVGVAMFNLGAVATTLGFNQIVLHVGGYYNAYIVLLMIGVAGLLLVQIAISMRKKELKKCPDESNPDHTVLDS